MEKKNNPKYFNDFIKMSGHRVAYIKFINNLNTKLSTPLSADEKIIRFDFRRDLQYGELQELYRIFAEMLAVKGIINSKYNRNSLYRWICSPEHSNLRIKSHTM